MTPETVIDILREALWLIVLLSAVIIGPGLAIGLVVSTFQAATQINEQTLSFLPRLLITLIVIIAAGPWMLTTLLDLANGLISRIPYLIG